MEESNYFLLYSAERKKILSIELNARYKQIYIYIHIKYCKYVYFYIMIYKF